MKFDMNGCPRDDRGLPMVPPARFLKFDQSEVPQNALTRFRHLPVLQGLFDQGTVDNSLARHCGVGWFATEASPIVAIRMQVGPVMMYWLMNAADPEVWRALDRWHSAKAMVLCTILKNKIEVCAKSFELPEQVRALRFGQHRGKDANAAIVRVACRMLLTDELASRATSDIPAYPKLDRVLGCLVTTKRSGTIGVVVVDDEAAAGHPH